MPKKKLLLLFTIIFMLLLFSKSGSCATVSGTVSFSEAAIADSIIISVDSYYYSDHVAYVRQANLKFSFDLQPGKYQLSIKSVKSATFFTYILIADQKKNLVFNVNLLPKGQESTAIVKGFKYHEEYNSLVKDIIKFNKKLLSLNMGKATKEDFINHNIKHVNELNELEKKYSPYFNQIFIETRLSHLIIFHPLTFYFIEYGRDGEIDSSEIETIYKTDIFSEFFNNNMALLKELDPNSILLGGVFGMALGRMEGFESCLLQDNKVEKNHFMNFLTDFASETPNRYCAANLLFTKAEGYAKSNPEKAMFLLSWLNVNGQLKMYH